MRALTRLAFVYAALFSLLLVAGALVHSPEGSDSAVDVFVDVLAGDFGAEGAGGELQDDETSPIDVELEEEIDWEYLLSGGLNYAFPDLLVVEHGSHLHGPIDDVDPRGLKKPPRVLS